MENNGIDDSEELELVSLIQDLLQGTIEVNVFRQTISKFSEDMATLLFRENFSKFYIIIQEKISNTFRRYFFDNNQVEQNEFFKFAHYRGFWYKLKDHHDSNKFLDFTFTEIIEYFEPQFSKIKVTNLFRDSFPKFSSSLKSKVTDAFTRYFFSDTTLDKNEFWRFVNFKNFWAELRKFHDVIYSRDMTLNEVIKFFEQTLFRTKSHLNLSFLQKKIIEKLGKNPSSHYNQLAKDLDISEREVSVTLKELNLLGIYLGSLISYKSFNLHEFFSFNRSGDFGKNTVMIDKYLLFPDLNITHGIMSRKKHGPSFYYVKEKKMYLNPDILNKGLSIQDWKKHSFIKQKNFSDSVISTEPKRISSDKQPYLPHLLRNCELDFKRPDIKIIAETHDISARTLFRVKSRLIEDKIIQPCMVVEHPDLLKVVMISKSELAELYNKVPFIRTYQIHDDFGETSWLSYLSIFMSDFKHIYSLLNRHVEVFQVIKKQITDVNNDSSEFFSDRGSGLTPYPRDPGDDMTGAAAGMPRKYKDEKKD